MNDHHEFINCSTSYGIREQPFALQGLYKPQPAKERGVFTEIACDVKKFILEYRGVLYFIAIALLLDEFIFKGVFRARLQSMADKLVAKVEQKLT